MQLTFKWKYHYIGIKTQLTDRPHLDEEGAIIINARFLLH